MPDSPDDSSPMPLIVHAVDALLIDRPGDARRWLETAIESTSLRAVNHGLSVAGRALLADADLDPERGPAPDAAPIDALDGADQFAIVWSALQTVTLLVARGGYPAEVVLDPGV